MLHVRKDRVQAIPPLVTLFLGPRHCLLQAEDAGVTLLDLCFCALGALLALVRLFLDHFHPGFQSPDLLLQVGTFLSFRFLGLLILSDADERPQILVAVAVQLQALFHALLSRQEGILKLGHLARGFFALAFQQHLDLPHFGFVGSHHSVILVHGYQLLVVPLLLRLEQHFQPLDLLFFLEALALDLSDLLVSSPKGVEGLVPM
mmetsp:Transcript_62366/g.146223  ORF Transcript_62366/g.146223 Transcript_62366/m.146223 type:complete len:204 (-) Transcript_62366:807-1418(-)